MSLQPTAWLAHDPVLPQRDALLDTSLVGERIGRLIGANQPAAIDRCERLRVNYQIGKSLRVLHRVDAGRTRWTISARAFRQGRGERGFEEACRDARPDGDRSVFYDAELDTVFWVFPHDRKLTSLPAVARAALPFIDGFSGRWMSTHLVAYAPEKSATLACLDAQGSILAYAKVAAEHRGAPELVLYRGLCDAVDGNPYLRLPRILAHVPEYRLVLLEAVIGRRMDDPAAGAEAVHDAGRLGAALAEFHALEPTDAPKFTRFAPDRLCEARRLVARVRPDVEEAADALVRELAAQQPDDRAAAVCLHGDLHPKNAIVSDGRVALIDVEDLAVGPAAADIGSFLAALAYLRCGGRLDPNTHDAIAGAFLLGYRTLRPLPTHECLRWHTAAALFVERIFRAVSRVRPLGLTHLPELVDHARAILGKPR
jgi:aminoglycoside phosphotransferase